jgi:hypothetical protein
LRPAQEDVSVQRGAASGLIRFGQFISGLSARGMVARNGNNNYLKLFTFIIGVQQFRQPQKVCMISRRQASKSNNV